MQSKLAKLLLFSSLRKYGDHFPGVRRIQSGYAAALCFRILPSSQSRFYGFSPRRPAREHADDRSEDRFLRSLNFGNRNAGDDRTTTDERRLRRSDRHFSGDDAGDDSVRSVKVPVSSPTDEAVLEDEREAASSRAGGDFFSGTFRASGRQHGLSAAPGAGASSGDRPESFLLQKLKLGLKTDEEKSEAKAAIQSTDSDPPLSESASEEADAIFKKMKETGLIPNAVAMLDGLCKDGLIQEAMKLFGIMREKGSMPEVVIYTAVVEGFCKVARFDDAKRVFRKMQSNGISPNAFSYKVFIHGLLKGSRLEDSMDVSLEMLDAGHSLTVVTFTELVDQFCRAKGVEEAAGVVRRLRERGLAVDDRAVREHLDRKGPSNPQTWEAIFGKKMPEMPF